MSNFQKLIQRFARDGARVFAVIFGLLAIVLIAMGGAVVDYVSLEQTAPAPRPRSTLRRWRCNLTFFCPATARRP